MYTQIEFIKYLINLIDPIIPIFLQGSMDVNSMPAIFCTYWQNESDSIQEYDNESVEVFNVNLTIYGLDIENVYEKTAQIHQLLSKNKFLCGYPYDIRTDDKNYTGRIFNVKYQNYK